MVARVDTVLRTELNVADGLADKNVYVLDPCCGTGAYLVEVLRHIGETLKHKGSEALMAEELKQAAMHRVFGFEILPAPFVVSHMQIGLLLQTLGAPLAEKGQERVGVYLTNALTGWEPPKGPKEQLPIWREMQEEHDAADTVKQEKPILVILGNPPYNAFAGVSPIEEEGLVAPYKEGLKKWGITKNYLDDLYVRFFRIAERRIAEKTGRGIVCYISNFSYLNDPSFVVMRQRFLSNFGKIWIDCLNGDSRETGKLTPDGKPDPSVFSTQYNREGIRVGTAICLAARKSEVIEQKLFYRNLWGIDKNKELFESLTVKRFDNQYDIVAPSLKYKFTFQPVIVKGDYELWPKVLELCIEEPMFGLNENRAGALQGIEKEKLITRIKKYFDSRVIWREIESLNTGLSSSASGFDPKIIREKALSEESYDKDRIVRYLRRPFEVGWAYLSDVSPLWNRSRPELRKRFVRTTFAFLTRPTAAASPEGVPFLVTKLLGEQDLMRGHAYYFPIFMTPKEAKKEKGKEDQLGLELPTRDKKPIANLSDKGRVYLVKLGIGNPNVSIEKASLVWMHALAIGYASAYLSENADGVRQDWPRIPLPKSAEVLHYSATLGKRIAELLDTENDIRGITGGTITPEMKIIAEPQAGEGKQFQSQRGHFDLTAGWGHGGKDGVTMPGKGKIVRRDYTKEELAAIEKGAKARGLTLKQALVYLGEATCDIYLNDTAYWRNVPEKVWEYTIGGYQVIKKWLSYREKDLIDRALTGEEVKEVMNMARRITGIIWLEQELNANYKKVKSATYKW
jgi:hypothetical protein